MSAVARLPKRHRPKPEFAAAERRFRRDLPKLLPKKFMKWVVYTSKGCILEGADGVSLEEQCRKIGLEKGTYLVARVEPDAPVADATWLAQEGS